MMVDINELFDLCLEYDKEYRFYPEHEFEGRSFYLFVVAKLKLDDAKAEKEYNKKLDDMF